MFLSKAGNVIIIQHLFKKRKLRKCLLTIFKMNPPHQMWVEEQVQRSTAFIVGGQSKISHRQNTQDHPKFLSVLS
jgi:hypothetical protein